MTETMFIAIITGIVTLLASSGFWTFILKRSEAKDAKTRLLIGLAHDRILFLGSSYIHRGYISKEEYDDLLHYLYEPYREAGGNGSAEKVMSEVDKLPMYKAIYLPKNEHIEYLEEKKKGV